MIDLTEKQVEAGMEYFFGKHTKTTQKQHFENMLFEVFAQLKTKQIKQLAESRGLKFIDEKFRNQIELTTKQIFNLAQCASLEVSNYSEFEFDIDEEFWETEYTIREKMSLIDEDTGDKTEPETIAWCSDYPEEGAMSLNCDIQGFLRKVENENSNND